MNWDHVNAWLKSPETQAIMLTTLKAHEGIDVKRTNLPGGCIRNGWFCTCGHPLPWERDKAHAVHQATELQKALMGSTEAWR